MPCVFKMKNESVAVIVAIPVTHKEVEITSEKEVNNPEESNDEEKFRMVVERMANAIRVESFTCVRRRPKLSRTVDQLTVENGKTCPTYHGIWGQ